MDRGVGVRGNGEMALLVNGQKQFHNNHGTNIESFKLTEVNENTPLNKNIIDIWSLSMT